MALMITEKFSPLLVNCLPECSPEAVLGTVKLLLMLFPDKTTHRHIDTQTHTHTHIHTHTQ
jgi:hypothetical protein